MKRSKRKGPYTKILIKSEKKIRVLPRNYEITSNIVGSEFSSHSGKNFVSFVILEDMVGHKIGEFIPTREKFEFKKKKKGK